MTSSGGGDCVGYPGESGEDGAGVLVLTQWRGGGSEIWGWQRGCGRAKYWKLSKLENVWKLSAGFCKYWGWGVFGHLYSDV